MPFGYIYKIQFPNGKNYFGLTTTSLKQRKEQHKRCAKNGDTRLLYNALRKYDMVETFELIEVDTADTLEELCENEIRYIKEYNSYYMNGNGYNMTYGGEGISGYIFTEEDNRKNSERQKKYFEENLEEREKIALRSRNYWNNNEEAKQQMSEIKRNYWDNNEEAKQQMSEIKKKYFDNPEAIQKQSEITTKYFEDNPEARQQISESLKKYYKEVPEARQQISESLKKYYKEVPDAKQKNSEAQKKYYKENPEARQQMREIKKKYYENNPQARRKLSDRKGKNKPFDVFTTDGTYIKTFAYQFEAKEYLQKEYRITTNIAISAVLEGKQTKSAGFVFKYKFLI